MYKALLNKQGERKLSPDSHIVSVADIDVLV